MLEWVLHDGERRHVSTFASYPPGSRPHVLCPDCESPVELHLGEVRTWHAAHQNGSDCALTQPETALHYNTKMYLADQLRGMSQLEVLEPCMPTGRLSPNCKQHVRRVWLSGWSSVEEEQKYETRRPDISLLAPDGSTIGVVEVLVHHRVDREKKDEYAGWTLPWIEVKATDVMGNERWTTDKPLPIVNLGPGTRAMCGECAALARQNEQRKREEEARRRRNEEALERALEARSAEERARSRRRDKFRRDAASMGKGSRPNGVAFRRILAFDRLFDAGRVLRDVLVVADVFKSGERLGSFLGVASNLEAILRVRAPVDEPDRILDRGAESYLSREGRRMKIDVGTQWFPMIEVLHDQELMRHWAEQGADHLWPDWRIPVPAPWRFDWARAGADHLDLLRFLLVRYLVGLPVRYRWSTRKQEWFPTEHAKASWTMFPAKGRK